MKQPSPNNTANEIAQAPAQAATVQTLVRIPHNVLGLRLGQQPPGCVHLNETMQRHRLQEQSRGKRH